jgi:ubiquinone/menaquinone biosynthesis methyltransferase
MQNHKKEQESVNEYDPEFIRDLFNRMSGSYERVNYITSFGFSLRWRKQFLKAIAPTPEPIRILDLMTGMGETWNPIRSRFPNAELSTLDYSEGMLVHANDKNKKQFSGKVIVHHQDLLKNTLPADHYDVALSAFGLKTFNPEQINKLAAEVKRILKPGGRFSLIEVSAPTSPVLYGLYKLHLKHIVPLCGKIFLGNPEEYRMLWKYTERFGNSRRTAAIFTEAGLKTQYVSYFGGCATGVIGQKLPGS